MQSYLLQDCDCILLKKFNRHVQKALRQEFYKANARRTYNTSPELKDLLENHNQMSVVAGSSAFTSVALHAHLIVCISSRNCKVAIKISQGRPKCPIVSVVRNRKSARILCIYKNVLPTVFADKLCDRTYMEQIKVQLQHGIDVAKKLKLVSVGDLVVYCFDNFEKNDEEVTTYRTNYVADEIIKN